ncbi:MAG: hypothetical protein JRF61_08550 [Deltaproteobacteria bacterium]|nr:hypothetical protein [Deltaproteobacteria bacterium]
MMLGLQAQALHQSFEFHEKSIGSEALWYWINGAARWSALQPGFKAWWPRYETHYMPAFRDFANGLTRRGDTTPDRQLTSPGVDRATLHAGFSSKARR